MSEKFSDRMRAMFEKLPLRESDGNAEEGGFEVESLYSQSIPQADTVYSALGAGTAAGGSGTTGLMAPEPAVAAPVRAADHRGQLVCVPLTRNPLENTRGKKMVPVAVPAGFEAGTFRRVLSAAYRVYLETGRLVADDIAKYANLDKSRVIYLSQQEEFAYALEVRGIDTQGTTGLTAEQDAAILVLTDTSLSKTWNQRMRLAGVSPAKYNAWMKNPTFARHMSVVSEQLINNANVGLVELARKAGDGDLKAIDRQLAISGRYDPAQQSTVDALVLVNKMMEVLTTELSGQPETLMRISRKMREIGQEVSQVNRQIGY